MNAARIGDRRQTHLFERYGIRALLSKASVSRFLITDVPLATSVNNEGVNPAGLPGCTEGVLIDMPGATTPGPAEKLERVIGEKRTNENKTGRAADSPLSPPLVCWLVRCIAHAAVKCPA